MPCNVVSIAQPLGSNLRVSSSVICNDASSELNMSVKNTFLDCDDTVGGLLTVEEREALELPVRKTVTWCLATSRWTPSSLDTERQIEGLQSNPAENSECDSREWSSTTDGWSRSRYTSDSSQGSSAYSPMDSPRSAQDLVDVAVDVGCARSASASNWDSVDVESGDHKIVSLKQSGPRPVRALRGQWSVGAEGHELQECKPCAFLDSRKGCLSGSACLYCHLCEPGEKRRRQKEKRRLYQKQKAGEFQL